MSITRLHAHCVAVLLAICLWRAFISYAEWQESRYVDTVAGLCFREKTYGVALQRAALARGDLLPIYGACDILVADRFHPSTLFRSYPTGFAMFPIVRMGPAISLSTLEDVAALGDVRGRKIVILTTPDNYAQEPGTMQVAWLHSEERREGAYQHYFSRLSAYELIFSTRLPYAIKRAAAQRMLEYPRSLQDDGLLALSVRLAAAGSPWRRLAYMLLWPAGKLQTWFLELQDHYETLCFLRSHMLGAQQVPRRTAAIDWPARIREADAICREQSSNNPLGFDHEDWDRRLSDMWAGRARLPNQDENYRREVRSSEELADLRVLLQALRYLGARPLLVSGPLKGQYFDHMGVSAAGRAAYYEALQQVARDSDVPVATFQEYDEDRYFVSNEGGRFSASGWVHLDQVIGAFYHT